MMSLSQPPIISGANVGRWTVLERLGHGGHAVVHRVKRDDGVVGALKRMLPDTDPRARARFRREAEVLSRLDHPFIVRLLDASLEGPSPWMVVTLVDGPSVADRIRWHQAHNVLARRFEEAEQITRQLCEALSHVHARGHVHRDINPSNVLLTPDHEVRLTDFGLVTATETGEITRQGELVGTIAWMAPEIIEEHPVDHRADLYGVGAILYALLTLHRPVEADSVAGYLAQHLTTPPRPPHEYVPEVPPHLEQVCLRLLEKSPAQRFQSARQALDALDHPDEMLPMLLGRDAIVAAWQARLRDPQGGVFLVSGPPGSGRSTLLRHLAAATRAQAHESPSAPREVLFLDDLDPRDRAVYRAIRALVSQEGLVLAACERPPALTDLPTEHHALARLTSQQIGRLLRSQGSPSSVATVMGHRLAHSDAAWPGGALAVWESLRRAGWLARRGPQWVRQRPLATFRAGALPPPTAESRRWTRVIAQLKESEDDVAVEILALISLFKRPASATLIARAASRSAVVPRILDALIDKGLIHPHVHEDEVELTLAHPCAGAILQQHLDPATLRAHHLSIAKAMGPRMARRSPEVAHHLAAGGQVSRAMTLYDRLLRNLSARSAYRDVLHVAKEAISWLKADDESHTGHLVEMLKHLGYAQLRRGRWLEAVTTLDQAYQQASGLPDPAPRLSAALRLGQALYHLGRYEQAAPLLDEILVHERAEVAQRTAARLAMADIHLQAGRLDVAMSLCHETTADATRLGRPIDEVRARRSMAHVLSVEGRLAEGARVLEQADGALPRDGLPSLRADIGVRLIELDVIGGRYALAHHRARALQDLLEQHDIAYHLPETLALDGIAMRTLGMPSADEQALRAVRLSRQIPQAWAGRLIATRLLDRLQRVPPHEVEALIALTLPSTPLQRADAQRDAVVARLLSRYDSAGARAAIRRASTRPEAIWSMAEIIRQTDLAIAWARLGDLSQAAACMAHAARRLPSSRTAGVRMELSLTAHALGIPQVVSGLEDARDEVLARTPAHHREALIRWSDPAQHPTHQTLATQEL